MSAEQDGPQLRPCCLCLVPAVLQDSHIMPRWKYKRLIQTGNGNPNPVVMSGDTARLGGKQLKEYLLCEHCEARFGAWEKYIAESVALQANDRFPALERCPLLAEICFEEMTFVDVRALDINALMRFAVSVIWRASISTILPAVSLDAHEERVRVFLLDDQAELPSWLTVQLELIAPPPNLRIDRALLMPYCGRQEEGYVIHRFAGFGLRFAVIVGDDLPEYLDELCLVRKGRAILSDGAAMLPDMADTFAKVRANGGLQQGKHSRRTKDPFFPT